jgi:predicted DCC family thiol-disulfide oxidoreductase YuxK
VFAIPFARTLADRFYRWFARNRYRLGCGEHCAMHPA